MENNTSICELKNVTSLDDANEILKEQEWGIVHIYTSETNINGIIKTIPHYILGHYKSTAEYVMEKNNLTAADLSISQD